MRVRDVRRGLWYETRDGRVGECLRVSHGRLKAEAAGVELRVVRPRPGGTVRVHPYDILREVPEPSYGPAVVPLAPPPPNGRR